MSPRAIVIGIGNPLRGDDGAGPAVVARLEGRVSPDVALATVHQLTPEWAEPLSEVERVVFVDASVSIPAGQVRVGKIEPAQESFRTHDVSPGLILELARRLYGRGPYALVVEIGLEATPHGEGLSPSVEEAVNLACTSILEILRA